MVERKEVTRINLGELTTSISGMRHVIKALKMTGHPINKDIKLKHEIIIYDNGMKTIAVTMPEKAIPAKEAKQMCFGICPYHTTDNKCTLRCVTNMFFTNCNYHLQPKRLCPIYQKALEFDIILSGYEIKKTVISTKNEYRLIRVDTR